MATHAPTVRKHLSADALCARLRTGFAALADHRPGTPKIPLSDALMSAFAMFSLKSPSLLACDEERTESNVQRVYGMEQVPCDTRMRDILDPVDPESLRPLFKHVFGALQRGKALEDMVCIEGHDLLLSMARAIFPPRRFTARRVESATTATAPSRMPINSSGRPSSIRISAQSFR